MAKEREREREWKTKKEYYPSRKNVLIGIGIIVQIVSSSSITPVFYSNVGEAYLLGWLKVREEGKEDNYTIRKNVLMEFHLFELYHVPV